MKGIQAESGAEINIEDDGTVHIFASKQEGLDRAKSMIARHVTGNRSGQGLHRQGRFHHPVRCLHGSAARKRRTRPRLRTRRRAH
ncbi:MAG: hypothetical protein ACRDBP_18695 [Luteolibacter sp.]